MSAYDLMRYSIPTCAAALLLACATVARAGDVCHSIQAFSRHLVPLPLRCMGEDPSRLSADDTLSLIYTLASPDDRLVLMMRDGSYTLFNVAAGHNLVPTVMSPLQARAIFDSFTGLPNRVWVVCGDALVGAVPQPPAQYAALLNRAYTLLPFPLPTYYGDFSAPRTSTKYLTRQAALLESLCAGNPSLMTQQFYTTLGRIYRQVGSNTAELATYRRGIGQFPDSPFIHRAMADCYFTSFSNYSEAIDYNFKANRFHKRQNQGQPLYEAVFSAAMAYERMGDYTKAQLQYSDILGTIDVFPDREWESRTRRYLGDLHIKKGTTNEGIRQFQIDLGIAGLNPAYSFQRLLAVFSAPGNARDYADTARTYFLRCGTNDAYAIFAYIGLIERNNDLVKLAETVRTARGWLRAYPALLADLRKHNEWWTLWATATARVSVPAEP